VGKDKIDYGAPVDPIIHHQIERSPVKGGRSYYRNYGNSIVNDEIFRNRFPNGYFNYQRFNSPGKYFPDDDNTEYNSPLDMLY
jgi:hypothetical protein